MTHFFNEHVCTKCIPLQVLILSEHRLFADTTHAFRDYFQNNLCTKQNNVTCMVYRRYKYESQIQKLVSARAK